MNKNYRKNFYLLFGVVALGLLLVAPLEKLRAQAEVSNSGMGVAPTKNLPDKKISLELVQLEGKDVDLAKCHEIDAQSVHLLPGQKLVVTLNKKWLFYQQVGKATLGTNYNVQSALRVDDWDGWENWLLDRTPLECKSFSFYNFYNNYFYQAGNDSGKVTLSFISETYPRYYSSLHVIIN